MMMMTMMMTGFLASGAGLLSVAVQLGRNKEPGGDDSTTTERQVRCFSYYDYSRNSGTKTILQEQNIKH